MWAQVTYPKGGRQGVACREHATKSRARSRSVMADAQLKSFQISRQRARHASRRNRSISGPRFRRKPPIKHPTETPENAPPGPNRPPPYGFLTRSRNPDFWISPTVSPGIADFGVGPKSGDLWAGRLSIASPRRSAQLVDFRTPFLPETPSKTRDRGAGKRARTTATPCRLPPAGYRPPATPCLHLLPLPPAARSRRQRARKGSRRPAGGSRPAALPLPPAGPAGGSRRGGRRGGQQRVDVKKRARPGVTPCRLPPSATSFRYPLPPALDANAQGRAAGKRRIRRRQPAAGAARAPCRPFVAGYPLRAPPARESRYPLPATSCRLPPAAASCRYPLPPVRGANAHV